MLNDLDVKRQMRRLAAVYHAPDDREAAVSVWRDVLGDLDEGDLDAAVSQYLREPHTYFPKPGKIREIAQMARRENGKPTEAREEQDPSVCRVCGAVLRELSPAEQVAYYWDDASGKYVNGVLPAIRPRLGILHSLKRHREAGQPVIGSYWQ